MVQIENILKELDAAAKSQVPNLLESWRSERWQGFWRQDSRLYRAFGLKLLEADYPIRAFELLREGLLFHPHDLELKYRQALSLARCGNISKAEACAQELDGNLRECLRLKGEILSLLGRLKKDRFEQSQGLTERAELAIESAQLYGHAHRESGELFPAINAATMFLLGGQEARAREQAGRVIRQAQKRRKLAKQRGDYWLLANLAEAHLLLGDESQSLSCYQEACAMAQNHPASIASMRRQLQLIETRIPIGTELRKLLFSGCVVVFAGHMLDHPENRARLRFPNNPNLENLVAEEIEAAFERMNPMVGFGSIANGSDLIFAERALERGIELHLVLPFERQDFYRTSVDFGVASMDPWRRRADHVLSRAAEIHHATKERYLGDEVLFEFGNTFAQGLAIMHAQRVWSEVRALVVLDANAPKPSPPGGTSSFLDAWRTGGRDQVVIDLTALRGRCKLTENISRTAETSSPQVPPRTSLRRQVRFLLFGDLKNFGGLDDLQAPTFFARYLETVRAVIDSMPESRQPIFRNTWGDGLFLVFDQVTDCAEAALSLGEALSQVDWAQCGFARETNLRIGLHAGPVYRDYDPFLGKETVFGSQVIRAARIEPVATMGNAFASEQFAAALAAAGNPRYVCDYLATTTSDLVAERDRLRRELMERGCQVLPESPLPVNLHDLRERILQELARCQVAVHFIGKYYGVTPEDSPKSLPEIQLELTAQHAAGGRLARWVWTPESLLAADSRQDALLGRLDSDSSFGGMAEWFEGDLFALRRELIRKLAGGTCANRVEAGPAQPDAGPARLYLLFGEEDKATAAALEDRLFDAGFEVFQPSFDADVAAGQTLHRENLASCDAVLIYYGTVPRTWVDIKLREILKAAGYGRSGGIPLQAVYLAAPLDESKQRFRSHQAQVIRANGDNGVSGELAVFIESVRKLRRPHG